MLPQIGDIYCIYSEPMQQYSACQVIDLSLDETNEDRILAALLELDWIGYELPDEYELGLMKPLVCDFYFWNSQLNHSYVPAEVPKDYIYVGSLPPLTDERTISYEAAWSAGSAVYKQRGWEKIAPRLREQFKKAAQDRSMVELGTIMIERRISRIDDSVLQHMQDWSQLDQLPCLTCIETSRYDEHLLHYVRSNPFINELILTGELPAELNLSELRISRVSLNADNLQLLKIGSACQQLHLKYSEKYPNTIYEMTTSPPLVIKASDEGKAISLHLEGCYHWRVDDEHQVFPLPFTGLANVQHLHIVGAAPPLLSMENWMQHFPRLRSFHVYDDELSTHSSSR